MTQYIQNFGAMSDGEAVTHVNIAPSGFDFHVPGVQTGVAVVADTFPSGAVAVEETANSDAFYFNTASALSTNGMAWSIEFFYKTAMPGSNDYLWDARYGSGVGSSGVRCIIDSSGFPFVQATGSTIWTGTTTKLVAGTKYRCDVELVRSATAGTVRVRFYKCSAPSTVLPGLDSTLKTGLNTGSSAFSDMNLGAAGGNTVTGCTRAYGLIRGDDASTATWGAPPNNITIVVNDNLGLTDGASATHSVPGGTTTITINDHLGLTDTGAPQTVVHTITLADNLGLTDTATASGSSAGGSRLPVFRDKTTATSGGAFASTGFSIGIPAAAQIGDYAVLVCQNDHLMSGLTVTSPGGSWIEQADTATTICYTFVITAADLGQNIAVSWSATGSQHWSAMVACWSNVSGATVVPGGGGTGASVTLPSVTTSWDQTLLVGFGLVQQTANASTAWTLPTGWTSEATVADTTDEQMIICADQSGDPTGAYTATGTQTFTAPYSGSINFGVTVALAGSPAALDASSSTTLPVQYLLGSAVTSLSGGSGAWPQIVTQALFGQNPNDPAPAMVWADLSERTKQASITRGAPYELAQANPGSGQLLLDNADGAVDPTNTSSPFWPDVQIMCRVRQFAIVDGQLFPVWGAYVYGWGQTWAHDQYGNVQASLVDALATLQGGLLPVIASSMLTSSPLHLWPFAESYPDPMPSAAPVVWTFVDEGSDPVPLTLGLVYPNGGSYTGTSDASLPLRNDDAVPADTSEGIRLGTFPGTLSVNGAGFGESLVPLPGQVVTWELFGIEWSDSGEGPGYWLVVTDGTTEWFSIRVAAAAATVSPTLHMHDGGSGTWSQTVTGLVMTAGQANHLIVTIDATNAQPLVTVYGNGALMFTALVPVAFPGAPVTDLNLAGSSLGGGSAGDIQIIAAAMFDRYLSPAEVADHWASYTGYSGDLTGARAQRVLGWGNWNGPAIIDPGTSTMQGVGVGGATIADTLQQIVDTEFGLQYVDAAGNLVFAGRARFTDTTPAAVFGDGGGAEIPYEGDIAFSLDATYVYDRVLVSRNNGVTAPVRTPATTALVFGNTLTKTIYSDTDEDAFNQAAYLASVYALPSVRLATVTIDVLALITQDMNSGTSLTQTLLGLDITSVVTVIRRGVSTSTGQYRVEQIADQTTPDSWTRAYQLAPLQPAPTWGIPGDYTDSYGDTY